MTCGSLLYRASEHTKIHDMPALEGLYARFVNNIAASRHSCEIGDIIVVPNQFFKSVVHSTVPFPFIVEITPDRKPKDGSSYHSVFGSIVPASGLTNLTFLPHWMFEALQISEGATVRIRTVHLPERGELVLSPVSHGFNSFQVEGLVLADLDLESAYHTFTSGSQILLPFKNQPGVVPVKVATPNNVGLTYSSSVKVTLGPIIEDHLPHHKLECEQEPVKGLVPEGGFSYFAVQLPPPDTTYLLSIESPSELEVNLSTVNSRPKRPYCEWSMAMKKPAKIEISERDGFLANNVLYVGIHSFFDTSEFRISVFSSTEQGSTSR